MPTSIAAYRNNSYAIRMILAAIAAFSVYTCMYAFRKPFTVANYGSLQFLGIEYKIWLVIAQTIGYTVSKFFGIRFIAEIDSNKRWLTILKFIGVAWLAMFFFAIIPPPFNIICLLVNGFPLGVIYGLVFSYLEGRRLTELLGAALACSFIFASGFTQTIGKYILLDWNVGIWWMPFAVAAIFFPPLIFFCWLLEKTPAPDESDILERTERKKMNKGERRAFVKHFFTGLILLIVCYIMLTMLRDYRSNFASNIWEELGWHNDPSIFTSSELLPSVIVLIIMSSLVAIRNNWKALLVNHVLIIAGLLIASAATILFSAQTINGFWWMTLTGIGLYMGYVPFNCMLFERLIAAFKYVSTAGFIIYLADSFGYLGSDVILLVKNFAKVSITWTDFFVQMIYVVSILGIILTIASAIYFKRKYYSELKNK